MAKTPDRCPVLVRHQASETGAARRGCGYPRLLSPHTSSCLLTAMKKQSWRACLASLAHLATGVLGPRCGLGNCCGMQGRGRDPQVWAGSPGGLRFCFPGEQLGHMLGGGKEELGDVASAGHFDVRGVTRPTPPSLVFKSSAGTCLPTFFCFKQGIGLTF